MFAELTKDQISALEAEHGDVYCSETSQGPVYLKAPTAAVIDMFQELREKSVRRAQNDLVKKCLLFPAWPDYEAALKRFCMLSVDPANTLIDVSKGDEQSRTSKSAGSAQEG